MNRPADATGTFPSKTDEVRTDHAVDISAFKPPVIDPDKMLAFYKVVEFNLARAGSWIIQFVGAREGEGTSTIAREFAMAAALRIGKSVLLLDANRFRPSQQRFFRIQSGPGWLEVLDCDIDIDASFHQVADSILFVAPIHEASDFKEEIFDSQKLNGLWTVLRKRFDLIIIDTAPLSTCPDGLAIAPTVDGVVLVVEAENTKSRIARSARDMLTRVGGNLLGFVFNKNRNYVLHD